MAKDAPQDQFTLNFSGKPEDSPWWAGDVSAVLKPLARQMLQDYAGIPPEQVIDHIEKTVG